MVLCRRARRCTSSVRLAGRPYDGRMATSGGLDPILPNYIVPSAMVDPDPIEQADRRCLDTILAAAEDAVLSNGRLSSDGKRIGSSVLMPPAAQVDILHRDGVPRHALTEADRLLARPQDRNANLIVASALAAWHDWNLHTLTLHDGLVAKAHPLLSALLLKPQSPTSLSLLLRDPLGYVWYYALGWRDLAHKERSLILPPDDLGRTRTRDPSAHGRSPRAAARLHRRCAARDRGGSGDRICACD